LQRFDRVAAARGNRVELIVLLILGYLLVWLGFGVSAHLLDAALHAMIQRSAWLTFNPSFLLPTIAKSLKRFATGAKVPST
jgi:predicted metal-binding membrane protein